MTTSNTEFITNLSTFDIQKLYFSSKPVPKVPNAHRVNIFYQEGKEISPLIFVTDELHSFGVQENRDLVNKDEINGYQMSLSLSNLDGATEYQKKLIDALDTVSKCCREWVVKNRTKIGRKDLEASDVRKLSAVYRKIGDDGKVSEDSGPILYAKLITTKRKDKSLSISTIFQLGSRDVSPFEYLGKNFKFKALIKIESIFVGTKITLQVKLSEVVIQPSIQKKRLLAKEAIEEEVEEESEEEVEVETEESGYQVTVEPEVVIQPEELIPQPEIKPVGRRTKRVIL